VWNAFAGDDDAMFKLEGMIRCQIQPASELHENSAVHRPFDDLMVNSVPLQFAE